MLANVRKSPSQSRSGITTASGLLLAKAEAADLDALVRLAVASPEQSAGDEEAVRAGLEALIDWGADLAFDGRGILWCARALSSNGRLLGLILERCDPGMLRLSIDVWFCHGMWGAGYAHDIARELKARREDRHWSTEAESMLASPPAMLSRVGLRELLRPPSIALPTLEATLPQSLGRSNPGRRSARRESPDRRAEDA